MKVDEPFFGLLSMRFDGFCKLVSDRVVLIELSFWSFLRISGYFTFSLRKPTISRTGNDLSLGFSEIFIRRLIDNQLDFRMFFVYRECVRFIE